MFLIDFKVYEDVLEDELDRETRHTMESCRGAINTAACTKLEFKVINSMMNLDKKQAREEVVLAEREFSTKYKLRKEDWVHPSILKKRTEFLKLIATYRWLW